MKLLAFLPLCIFISFGTLAKTVIHPETGEELRFADTSSNKNVQKQPCNYALTRENTFRNPVFTEEWFENVKRMEIEEALNSHNPSADRNFSDASMGMIYRCRLAWRSPLIQSGSRCHISLFESSLTIPSLETDALKEGRWCVPQQASLEEEVFRPQFDVPAAFIDLWTDNYIVQKWTKAQGANVINKNHPDFEMMKEIVGSLPDFDWLNENGYHLMKDSSNELMFYKDSQAVPSAKVLDDHILEYLKLALLLESQQPGVLSEDSEVLFQLNLQASSIWNAMVMCQGNAEAARWAYFQANWRNSNCPEMQHRIAQFIINMRNVFETATLQRTKIYKAMDLPGSVRRFLLRKTGLSKARFQVQRAPLPAAHPLFMQVSVQIIAQSLDVGGPKNFRRISRHIRKRIGEKTENFYHQLFDVFNMVPNGDCPTWGLWPSASLATFKSVHRRSLEVLSSGSKMTDPGVIVSNCRSANGHRQRLPQIYQDHSDDIAKEYIKIQERYLDSLESR